MPPVDSVEDLEKYPEFTARFRKKSQPWLSLINAIALI
jgi:hypothetical protein